jgi:hypothetical protein
MCYENLPPTLKKNADNVRELVMERILHPPMDIDGGNVSHIVEAPILSTPVPKHAGQLAVNSVQSFAKGA